MGPIHNQAREVLELLTDGDRCQVLLATLPEETPVNELVQTASQPGGGRRRQAGPGAGQRPLPRAGPARAPRTAESLLAGQTVDAAVATDLLAAATYRRRREALQAGQVDRLAELLPLPQLVTSFRFTPALGPHDLAALAGELRLGIEALA